jgi:hypothetical protein
MNAVERVTTYAKKIFGVKDDLQNVLKQVQDQHKEIRERLLNDSDEAVTTISIDVRKRLEN